MKTKLHLTGQHQNNTVDSPSSHSPAIGQLIFSKGTSATQWGKNNCFIPWIWKTRSPAIEKKKRSLLHTMHNQANFKWQIVPKIKPLKAKSFLKTLPTIVGPSLGSDFIKCKYSKIDLIKIKK